MDLLFEHVKNEWATLKSAPASFVFLLFLGVATGVFLQGKLQEQEILNLESLLRLKEGELTELRKMEERITEVEARLRDRRLYFPYSMEETTPSDTNPSRQGLRERLLLPSPQN